MIASGGGGGGGTNGTGQGAPGGAAGELCLGLLTLVAPGGSVSITIGAAGSGLPDNSGSNNLASSAGNPTTVGSFRVLGPPGGRVTAGRCSTGGGVLGYSDVAGGPALSGLAEAVTFFGGAAGGNGNGITNSDGKVGGNDGGAAGGIAGTASGRTGGSGGGAGAWGAAGAGGNGNVGGHPPAAASYGCGGGGSGDPAGGVLTGGNGSAGYALLTWWA
jgi:hypothetical protein